MNKPLVAAAIVLAIGAPIYAALIEILPVPVRAEDIFFIWTEGQRIASGENPYARILDGDMVQNRKYATHFPAFYCFSALTYWMGADDFRSWLTLWRPLSFLASMAVALLIFAALAAHRLVLLGVLGALWWLFSRWTLWLLRIGQIDAVAIALLLGSLILFERRRHASLLLFGASLAVKQIAIWLVPVYLLWIWQSTRHDRVRSVAVSALLIAAIPAAFSLPFLLWNAEGFVRSIAFSVTRAAAGRSSRPSLDFLLGLEGVPARLPMLALMLLVYVGVVQRKIGKYTSGLLTMTLFVEFNPVIFNQYQCWTVPFVPLAICDLVGSRRRETAQANGPPAAPA